MVSTKTLLLKHYYCHHGIEGKGGSEIFSPHDLEPPFENHHLRKVAFLVLFQYCPTHKLAWHVGSSKQICCELMPLDP